MSVLTPSDSRSIVETTLASEVSLNIAQIGLKNSIFDH